jgi:hypothetical protein
LGGVSVGGSASKNTLLNPKHKSRGPSGRNPKQGSKSQIQMFKTKSKTRTRLKVLATRTMKMTGGQIAAFVSAMGTFHI